jgi:hypothetical protein
MARSRRVWSELRTDIRRWINDNDTTSPEWSDADLLAFFNECKDQREMDLFDQHEGWGVYRYSDNLVAGQQEYALPEETGRIRTLFIKDSGGDFKRAIQQDRQFTGSYLGDDTQASSNNFTYSLKDNHVFLYPCPSASVTNGLQLELEVLTERIANDTDKLPDSWPGFAETLLVYDAAIAALSQQATSEGDLGQSQVEFLIRQRTRYEESWDEYTASRTTSIICSPGWNQGA